MSEAIGVVNSVVTRDELTEMWGPYGSRAVVDDSINNPPDISPSDAIQIAYDSTPGILAEIQATYGGSAQGLDYIAELWEAMDTPSDQLLAVLAKSHEKQRQNAAAIRERAIDEGLKYTIWMHGALGVLACSGVLTNEQASLCRERLLGSDGQPFVQYTPMSSVGFSRLLSELGEAAPSPEDKDLTHFGIGASLSTQSMNPSHRNITVHNRPHEAVHCLSGLNPLRVTSPNGRAELYPSAIGAVEDVPAPKFGQYYTSNALRCSSLNEGITDFIARALMKADNRLGKPIQHRTSYSQLVPLVDSVYKDFPQLYGTMIDAYLADGTPENPDQKHESLAKMHDIARRTLDVDTELHRLFFEVQQLP